jgi:hypothetical protein
MNTSEQWGGHGLHEKYMETVSAGAATKRLTPDELRDLAQLMIDAPTESDAKQYQEPSVAGFYSPSHEPKVRPVGRVDFAKGRHRMIVLPDLPRTKK